MITATTSVMKRGYSRGYVRSTQDFHCVGYGLARVSISIFTGVIEYSTLMQVVEDLNSSRSVPLSLSVIPNRSGILIQSTKYRGSRIRIDNTRLFLPPPTTTLMTGDVVVNQLVLFPMLQSFFRIPEE